MASIEAYQNAAGETLYRVRYRKPDHTQASKRGFKGKRAAQQFMHSIESDKGRGLYIDANKGRATIATLGTQWLENQHHLKPSSLRPVASAWRIHVEPRWGSVSVVDVGHSDVQSWVTKLAREKSATTVLRAYGVLAAILDVAVRDRRIQSNPARGVKLPRKKTARRVYLTHEQVARLSDAAMDRGIIVDALAYTGLRWGELTGLRVRDVDLVKRRLNVSENAVMVNGSVIVGTPKSHAGRSVPYPSFLGGQLAELCRDRSPDSILFGDGHDHMKLPDSRGGWFAYAVKRCQKVDDQFPRVTPHDLRHTAASLAISAGANVKAVQRMLGHASAAMTLDTYADLFDDDLNSVADALSAARMAASVSK